MEPYWYSQFGILCELDRKALHSQLWIMHIDMKWDRSQNNPLSSLLAEHILLITALCTSPPLILTCLGHLHTVTSALE